MEKTTTILGYCVIDRLILSSMCIGMTLLLQANAVRQMLPLKCRHEYDTTADGCSRILRLKLDSTLRSWW